MMTAINITDNPDWIINFVVLFIRILGGIFLTLWLWVMLKEFREAWEMEKELNEY